MLIAEDKTVIEGEENDERLRAASLLQMGSNIPGFDEAVMGMMPGEERTFELTYPEDYEEEDKRGKKAAYHRQSKQHQREKTAGTQRRIRHADRRI